MNPSIVLKRPAAHLLRASRTTTSHLSNASSRFIHHAFRSSTPEFGDFESTRILGRSSIFLQDGLDIQELPLIIRRMQENEFQSLSSLHADNKCDKPSNQDVAFKLHLQDCSTVSEVIKLLEVPDERVSPFSASYSLIRLSQLHDGNASDCDSFIRKAVFKELCDTASSDTKKLDNDTLIKLVKCYLKSENHTLTFIQNINKELEHRIGGGTLTIDNMCMLIDNLSASIKSDMSLLKNSWIHLGSRYREIDETNIAKVYAVFKHISRNQRYIANLLDKRVQKVWWKLIPSDIAVICNTLTYLNMKSTIVLNIVPKWLICNIQEASEKKFTEILSFYLYFNVGNEQFFKSLNHYVTLGIDKLSKKFIAMSMSYCHKVRILMPKLLNSVADDFVMNNSQYSITEQFHVIRTYGHLNYSPLNSSKFFSCVENILLKEFDNFHPSQIVELFATFSYTNRLPINFLNRVLNAHFLTKIKNDEHSLKFLRELYIAVLFEMPMQPPSFINFLYIDNKFKHFGKGSQWVYFHKEIGKVLYQIKSSNYIKDGDSVSSFYAINYTFNINSRGVILKDEEMLDGDAKIAILGIMPDEVCHNSRHVIGPIAMRRRHLELINFSVIEIHYDEFMWACKTSKQRFNVIQNLLKKHMKMLS